DAGDGHEGAQLHLGGILSVEEGDGAHEGEDGAEHDGESDAYPLHGHASFGFARGCLGASAGRGPGHSIVGRAPSTTPERSSPFARASPVLGWRSRREVAIVSLRIAMLVALVGAGCAANLTPEQTAMHEIFLDVAYQCESRYHTIHVDQADLEGGLQIHADADSRS